MLVMVVVINSRSRVDESTVGCIKTSGSKTRNEKRNQTTSTSTVQRSENLVRTQDGRRLTLVSSFLAVTKIRQNPIWSA